MRDYGSLTSRSRQIFFASAGTNRNVIPALASASADVRVMRVAGYDGIEQKVRERAGRAGSCMSFR